MNLTIKSKLIPSKEQVFLIKHTLNEYIFAINELVELFILAGNALKLSSKDINFKLPSAVKNQAIRDAKSIYSKYNKTKIQSILKKPVCIWNNQNHSFDEESISVPVTIENKSKRINIKTLFSNYHKELLKQATKIGTLRISKKNKQYYAQITIEVKENNQNLNSKVMGVDLGIKVPAVAVTEDRKTKFFGNGRKNKYIRRKYKILRKQLGKEKKLKKLKEIKNKEQRYMNDQDHKISREIINFALKNKVTIIRLEVEIN